MNMPTAIVIASIILGIGTMFSGGIYTVAPSETQSFGGKMMTFTVINKFTGREAH